MIAKNSPIPAPIPSFKLFGIELINQARKGVNEIAPVMRVRTAPQGRNYRIERTEKTDGGRWRLTLDVTTLLGRNRIVSVIEKIE